VQSSGVEGAQPTVSLTQRGHAVVLDGPPGAVAPEAAPPPRAGPYTGPPPAASAFPQAPQPQYGYKQQEAQQGAWSGAPMQAQPQQPYGSAYNNGNAVMGMPAQRPQYAGK
jgi:hypothetical protein